MCYEYAHSKMIHHSSYNRIIFMSVSFKGFGIRKTDSVMRLAIDNNRKFGLRLTISSQIRSVLPILMPHAAKSSYDDMVKCNQWKKFKF